MTQPAICIAADLPVAWRAVRQRYSRSAVDRTCWVGRNSTVHARVSFHVSYSHKSYTEPFIWTGKYEITTKLRWVKDRTPVWEQNLSWSLSNHISWIKDLQPTLGFILPVYTDVTCLTILFEAVLHLYFFVSWLHRLSFSLEVCARRLKCWRSLPLVCAHSLSGKGRCCVHYIHICMRAHDEHVDDVSPHR